MAALDTHSKIDLIGFNLKMLAKGQQRSLLISAGAKEDKEFLLESCKKMAEVGVGLYATPGTHRFLAENGVESIAARKISSNEEPNIATLIENGSVDFVVNILTGDTTYDESSDAASIRSLSVKHGIPLYTDRKSTRLNSSHPSRSRMPSSA